MKNIGLYFVFFLFILLPVSCYKDKKVVFIPIISSNKIYFEVDSVEAPEVSTFGIRVRLVNKLNKKVMLFFTPKNRDYRKRCKDMVVFNEKDTFNIGVAADNGLFNEKTITSFLAHGFFWFNNEKGIFQNLDYFNKKDGKILYEFSGKLPKDIDKIIERDSLNQYDTIYVPTKIEGSTDKAKVVEKLYYSPTSLMWEKKIK
jgi:hypothetical protein